MLDAFRICRRHASSGHPGRHRPHHHPRPHQPRLRRHPHRHEGRRHGHDGHRLWPRARTAPSTPRQQAINSSLLEASIARRQVACAVLHRRRPATLRSTEVAEAAAHDGGLSPTKTPTSSTARSSTTPWATQVRITVIATGFKVRASRSPPMDFAPRKDLFASTEAPRVPAAVSQPVTFSSRIHDNNGRFADEDYIPDFLKRAR